jgi:hypothetical protein
MIELHTVSKVIDSFKKPTKMILEIIKKAS